MIAIATLQLITTLVMLLVIVINFGHCVEGTHSDDNMNESIVGDSLPIFDDFPQDLQLPSSIVPPFILNLYRRHKKRGDTSIIRAISSEKSDPLVSSGCVRMMPLAFNLSSTNQWEKITRAEINVQLPHAMFGTFGAQRWQRPRLVFRYPNGLSRSRHPLRASRHLHQLVFNVRHELLHIEHRGVMALEFGANSTCWPQSEPMDVLLVVKSRRKDQGGKRIMKRYANKKKKVFEKPVLPEQPSRTKCHRKELIVDFRAIGYKWVIEPRRYRAYVCQGSCRFPLSDHMNATNHATVQAMIHSVNPHQVAAPCCVPTSLAPISMLYYDSSKNIVMRNYDNMVVLACGCR